MSVGGPRSRCLLAPQEVRRRKDPRSLLDQAARGDGPRPVGPSTGEILCVLDTKYKDTITPATDDVEQIVAYAEKMGCQEAVLVYPRGLPRPFEARVGDIRVRSLSFSLDVDVDEAGHRFIHTVLGDAPI